MSLAFRPLLEILASGTPLSQAQAEAVFGACFRGEPTPAQVAAALTAMRVRGETEDEILACVRAMRRVAVRFDPGPGVEVIDTCGTGGDGAHTFNISTAVSFVLAGGGLKVAKHGGAAASSRSGAGDVLSALGIDIEASPAQSRRALDEAGICFLYAPAYNPAMRHVRPVRVELGFRTLFNLLGPLSNPAGARRQVVGVYDSQRLEVLARVLGGLGAERAWVVHGDGLDELTTTGETQVVEWRDGRTTRFTVSPEDADLPRSHRADLQGGDPAANAEALTAVLAGAPGPYRDIVLLNAAAAFVVADRVDTLREGAGLAAAAIDSGAARLALDRLRRIAGTSP